MKTYTLIWITVLASITQVAFASTLIVTSPGNSGPGTLRDAIASASSGDTITFDSALNGQTIGLNSELAIAKNLIISGPGSGLLTVSGSSTNRVFNVSAAATISGLTLTNGAASTGGAITGGDVTLTGCVVTANQAQANGGAIAATGTWQISNCTFSFNTTANFGGNGGAIYSTNVTLTITNCSFNHNSADVEGGAISISHGNVQIQSSTFDTNNGSFLGGALDCEGSASFTVTSCTFTNNLADIGAAIYNATFVGISDSTFSTNVNSNEGDGGAIFNDGDVTIARTTFTGNSTNGDGIGGAIYSDGTVSVTTSTFSGNSTGDDGGGGAFWNDGTLTLRDSTVSGNSIGVAASSFAVGGGIFNDGSLTIANSTIANNSSGDGSNGAGIYNGAPGTVTLDDSTIAGNSGGASTSGGGIFNEADATISTANTIIARNTAPSAPDLSGAISSRGYNLIGDTSGGSGFVGTDVVNVNPQLGPLQNNGGSTQTMALLPGSPAINVGDPGFNPNAFTPPMTTDQRGSARIIGGRLDIGAYEAAANSPPQITQLTAPQTLECTSPQGTSASVTVSVTDADGDPLTVQWIVNNHVVQTNTIPAGHPVTNGSATYTALYSLGTTTVTVSVSDGNSPPVTRSTTVTIRDTTPPVITSISANPNVLSPPNHKLVSVVVSVSATDNCDANPLSRIISVSSNEPGPDQYQITGDLTVKLQSERDGGGNGRVYTITVQCTDMSHNSSTRTVTVTVPKGGK